MEEVATRSQITRDFSLPLSPQPHTGSQTGTVWPEMVAQGYLTASHFSASTSLALWALWHRQLDLPLGPPAAQSVSGHVQKAGSERAVLFDVSGPRLDTLGLLFLLESRKTQEQAHGFSRVRDRVVLFIVL